MTHPVSYEVAKERPIIFSAPMVRAILEGRKTQTRRVVTLPRWVEPCNEDHDFELDGEPEWPHAISRKTGCLAAMECPYGQPGDRLWVRETWHSSPHFDCLYRSDYDDGAVLAKVVAHGGWRPSIFMPREFSRITLEIIDVRVQRLQEISANDVLAEGFIFSTKFELGTGYGLPNWSRGVEHSAAFAALWDEINAKRAPWASNPWVWAITFRRIKP